MADSPEDPFRKRKTIVTEEALRVNPAVLGLTLARPWRRAVAIGIDGLFCAILSATPSVVFGLAAGYVLLRASARKPSGGYLRRSFRFSMRLGAAVVLFIVAVSLFDSVQDRIEGLAGGDGEEQAQVARAGVTGGSDPSVAFSGAQAVAFAAHVVALRQADTEEEGREAVAELLEGMKSSGMEGEAAREAVQSLSADISDRPWMAQVLGEVLTQDAQREAAENQVEVVADSARREAADSLTLSYAGALTAGDSSAVDSLRPHFLAAVVGDTVEALQDRYEALSGQRDALEDRVEELQEEAEEGPSLMSLIGSIFEDLGLGLGWFGLYFTASTALWQGRTPGKKLLGIRVISLTGKPIGWWASFERFGGYAAGVATGLLGFAQILWDDNRQAIHDKIAVTAVIREKHPSA